MIILGDGKFDGSELIGWFEQQSTWPARQTGSICRAANLCLMHHQNHRLHSQCLHLYGFLGG